MARQIRGLLYFYAADTKQSFMIFWSILVSTLAVSILAGFLFLRTMHGEMVFAISMALYIYCAIYGFMTVKQGIPFAIKMGATRKNIFISIGIFFLGLAIVKAILGNVLQVLIVSLTNAAEIDTFRLIHPSQFLQDTWLTRMTIDITVMFFLLAIMYALGLLFYKYGLIGGGSTAAAIIVFLVFGLAQGFLTDFIIQVYQSLTILFFYEVLLAGAVVYVLTWLLTRKLTIR